MIPAGQQLGPYRILSQLGAGGMGEVYLAEDSRLQRRVALKVLPPASVSDESSRRRLIHEARAAATLDHPNICTIYEVGEADGHGFIAMQFVDGETLAGRLKRQPPTLAAALNIGAQLATALGEAHRHGIVHRDIKPQNVMLTADGQVKVLDFGLAKATAIADHDARTGTVLTEVGSVVGTVPYMSPEQLRGEPLDPRSDIFALGCVIYELIAHKSPFAQAHPAETMAAILSRDPAPLPDSSVPSEVQWVVRKCLEKDRERRYQTMRDLAIDLESAAAQISTGALRPAHPSTARRTLGLIAGGVIAAGLAAGAYLYWRPAPGARVSPDEFVQLTAMDVASAPAVSPDGRMIAFMRGNEFLGNGQVYVKLLPNGDPVQLTNDPRAKYGPTFTPDGTRVAYTVADAADNSSASWSMWTVPVLGGSATRMLPNAAGLTWIDQHHVMFSEIEPGTGLHMGIVTASEDRADERRIYFPHEERAMAHYSYLSPDRRWVLVVEMDRTAAFQMCRLVPFDGTSPGRVVGPKGSCTSAAWSPDGRWMYFSADVSGATHLWRQRFPDGAPVLLTSSPTTEERGVAMAPDGRSLITSVGGVAQVLWVHDANADRSIPVDGSVSVPRLSRDNTRVYCLVQRAGESMALGLTQVTVSSGKLDRMLTEFSLEDFDISRDERFAAFTTNSSDHPHEIWLASLDRASPPRRVATDGDRVRFGRDGELVYRSLTGTSNTLMRIDANGTRPVRVFERQVIEMGEVSPDGEWAMVSSPSADGSPSTLAVPIHGGTPRQVCAGTCPIVWSPDGSRAYQTVRDQSGAPRLRQLPVRAGEGLPDFPTTGPDALRSNPNFWDHLAAGNDPAIYASVRRDQRGNLFRVPLR